MISIQTDVKQFFSIAMTYWTTKSKWNESKTRVDFRQRVCGYHDYLIQIVPRIHVGLECLGKNQRHPYSNYHLWQLYSIHYRPLMRSSHDHEDLVRYWLTDAVGGGQPILDKVFMVMSRPKSKVYYCFIKLSGISFRKTVTFIITAFSSRLLQYVSVAKNRNPKYTATRSLRCTHYEVHSSKCCLGQSEVRKIGRNSRSFNNRLY